jgi:hypothetical protein
MSQNPSLRKFRKKALKEVLDKLEKAGKVDGNSDTACSEKPFELLGSHLSRRISKHARRERWSRAKCLECRKLGVIHSIGVGERLCVFVIK